MAIAEERTETGGYVGQSVPRKEDAKLITGRTAYVDDLTVPGMVWAAVVRSPHAHARIRSVDVSKAGAAEGVIAAFSGQDLAEDWAGPLPMAWPVTEDINNPPHWPLAKDKVRYVGDGVAVVVAETRALAKDAAELVEVDYEVLPAVTDVVAALDEAAPVVHDEFGTNRSYTWPLEGPEAGAVDKAFAEAAVTVKERYRQQRLIPNAIEPRGVLVQPSASGEYTMWSSTQIPHILRVTLALVTGIPEAKLRIIAPDVGGGFGSKLQVTPEEALCLVVAKRLQKPVKWIEERSEGYLATHHGRDMIQEIELAATAEGKITAVRVHLTAAMGAYLRLVTPGIPLLGAWVYGGAYDIGAYGIEIVGVFTNTTPTDAYRGAGRPEATYAIERAVDALARKLDLDPVELRRLNLITEFPYTLASGLAIDSGDFHASLDRALELLDYEAVRRDQAERRERGRSEAARDRILDVRRDVRAGAVAHPRGDPLRRRRLGGGDDPLPADRDGAGRDGVVATRPGTRHDVVADHGGRARGRFRGRRGHPRRHCLVAAWLRHVREPQPRGGRRCSPRGRAEDRREGAQDRVASTRGRGGRPRVRPRHLQGERHRPDADRERGGVRRVDRAQPARRARTGARGNRRARPAELQLAGRLPHRGRGDRHGHGCRRRRALHRG
jgi:hypothetical protein